MSDPTEHYLRKELYALIQSDRKTFEFLQRASLDGLWYWDLQDPEQEWMSATFWQTLGIDPAQKKHLASEWQDLIFQEDLALALDNFNKHLADPDHPYDQVVRYKHASGSTVWVRCRGMAIRDSEGTPIRMLGAHNDITQQMEMEQQLNHNLLKMDELYTSTKLALDESQALFDMSPDALIQSDTNGMIVRANAEASILLGFSNEELLKMNVDELVPPAYRVNHKAHRDAHANDDNLRNLKRTRQDTYALHKNGREIPVEIRLNNIRTRDGRQVLAALRDITEYVELVHSLEKTISENKYLSMQANTDPLTGLYNRRYFNEVLNREFSQAKRHGIVFSVLMIDVDNFKDINDNHGHDIGDKVLLAITERFNQLMRAGDITGRLGGDEFVVLLPHTSQIAGQALAERIRLNIGEKPLSVTGASELNITLSIGQTSIAAQDEKPEQILKRADKALYDAKQNGRNRVICA
ncbi:sensor domain-containing diguanylate cyclase [Aliamphritea spongicola]|uniref:sensor domain-containing diguanylate cyclase n=1 Tax=Aliamphritea spongicola TaxID=707589 RepID=UPI00196BB1E0|nr:sensor domain-containing diguanylate cyclase [Aliamphritea spongicola]MBN3563281.1 diguanylate cyclase [Aliamphritea spongicola]